jgi:hypothetical protein
MLMTCALHPVRPTLCIRDFIVAIVLLFSCAVV